jgi:hypothetical protein
VDNPDQAAASLNSDLKHIQEWADRWLITFSPPKTEDMIISNKRPRPHPPVELGGEHIKQVSSHKHLGVHLTNDLTWTTHTEETAKKAKKCLGVIRHLKHKLDRGSLETLYTSFVRPIIEYADVVWDVPADNRHTLDVLDKVQKEAAKIVSGATARCTTQELHDELSWEPLAARRRLHRASLMHKIDHGMAPTYLQDLMPDQVQARTRYNLRNVENRDIPLARISSYSNSFFPAATRIWNGLHPRTRQSPRPNSFKRNYLREHPRPQTKRLYYQGTRSNQTNHAKLRLGCSQLNDDLSTKLHVRENPLCTCNMLVDETAEHFFLSCLNYRDIRQTLRTEVEALNPVAYNIKSLLHGNPELSEHQNQEMFASVHRFITKSNRL